jgi:hypothetical protein
MEEQVSKFSYTVSNILDNFYFQRFSYCEINTLEIH